MWFLAIALALPMPDTEERALKHAAVERKYRLHVPASFTRGKPVPLVIVLHGAGANGWITEVLTGFSPVAEKHGFEIGRAHV